MQVAEWTPIDDRLPTQEDADVHGCVIAWHVYQGVLITGWRYVAENRFFSHWMRTIPAPAYIDPKYKNR